MAEHLVQMQSELQEMSGLTAAKLGQTLGNVLAYFAKCRVAVFVGEPGIGRSPEVA